MICDPIFAHVFQNIGIGNSIQGRYGVGTLSLKKHSLQRHLYALSNTQNLEPVVNFELVKYLDMNGVGFVPNMMVSFEKNNLGDCCPVCCMNLFPIYSAGIEGRERHVARHMENAALSNLEQYEFSQSAANMSDYTRSSSIQSWSSGYSQGVTAIADREERKRAYSDGSLAAFLLGRVDMDKVASNFQEGGGLSIDLRGRQR